MTDKRARDRISTALARLATSQPFFGVLALHLKPTEVKGLNTMATDGYRLLYDPEWTLKQSISDCETIVSHEALHAVFEHPLRQKRTSIPLSKFRIATEHAVNNVLDEAGYAQPSVGWIMDPKYRHWTVEEICKDLKDQEKEDGDGDDQEGDQEGQEGSCDGHGAGDDVGIGGHNCLDESAAEGMSKEQMEKAAHDMKVRLSKAAAAAKSAGKMPAGMDRLVNEVLYPSVPWASLIRQFLETVIDDDYNWMKPSEEYLEYDIYIPSMLDEAITKPIVFAVDTSGSMSNDELSQIFGEISSIMMDLKPKEIHVIYADADVEGHDELTHTDLPLKANIHPKGGGGTSFHAPFQYVEEKGIEPLCLIYLSDMCCNSYPSQEPEFPVLWGSTTEPESMWSNPPFGDVVHVQVGQQ